MLFLLDLLFGQVIRGEVAESGVRIFGCELIFPWFVGLIVRSTYDVLELVLGYVSRQILWINVAGLSLPRLLASDDCCSFGSIDKYNLNEIIYYKLSCLLILLDLLPSGTIMESICLERQLNLKCLHHNQNISLANFDSKEPASVPLLLSTGATSELRAFSLTQF